GSAAEVATPEGVVGTMDEHVDRSAGGRNRGGLGQRSFTRKRFPGPAPGAHRGEVPVVDDPIGPRDEGVEPPAAPGGRCRSKGEHATGQLPWAGSEVQVQV